MKKIFIWLIVLSTLLLISSAFIRWVFPEEYKAEVNSAADEFNIDSSLIYSVIKAESNFLKGAVSIKNAKGLMQLTEQTATWCAEKLGILEYDVFDTDTNIRLGTFYLSYLLNRYDDKNLALAAYNAGHGNVDKWLETPKYSMNGRELSKIPYPETDRYLKKVLFYEKVYKFIYYGL